jgi:hypothetical protein
MPPDESKHDELDPVVVAYMPGVDRTLIRENLRLTHQQRIEKLQALLEMAEELRRAGAAARGERLGESF